MNELWDKTKEEKFFANEIGKQTPINKLFYKANDSHYFAYYPKNHEGEKATLQSRNALIGDYTENYTASLLSAFAKNHGYHSVRDVICEDLGLTAQSSADVAICKTPSRIQEPENILIIFEVKMSIVWNWEIFQSKLMCIGDFHTHQGNPGLLRSDTMLKAIGKSINIRVSNPKAARIPIIIIGNTPITSSYEHKVDYLKKGGIVQGFWSVNPKPLNDDSKLFSDFITNTPGQGFCTITTYEDLEAKLEQLLHEKLEFFSGMLPKHELGKLIEIANEEINYEQKAEKFLSLIRN